MKRDIWVEVLVQYAPFLIPWPLIVAAWYVIYDAIILWDPIFLFAVTILIPLALGLPITVIFAFVHKKTAGLKKNIYALCVLFFIVFMITQGWLQWKWWEIGSDGWTTIVYVQERSSTISAYPVVEKLNQGMRGDSEKSKETMLVSIDFKAMDTPWWMSLYGSLGDQFRVRKDALDHIADKTDDILVIGINLARESRDGSMVMIDGSPAIAGDEVSSRYAQCLQGVFSETLDAEGAVIDATIRYVAHITAFHQFTNRKFSDALRILEKDQDEHACKNGYLGCSLASWYMRFVAKEQIGTLSPGGDNSIDTEGVFTLHQITLIQKQLAIAYESLSSDLSDIEGKRTIDQTRLCATYNYIFAKRLAQAIGNDVWAGQFGQYITNSLELVNNNPEVRFRDFYIPDQFKELPDVPPNQRPPSFMLDALDAAYGRIASALYAQDITTKYKSLDESLELLLFVFKVQRQRQIGHTDIDEDVLMRLAYVCGELYALSQEPGLLELLRQEASIQDVNIPQSFGHYQKCENSAIQYAEDRGLQRTEGYALLFAGQPTMQRKDNYAQYRQVSILISDTTTLPIWVALRPTANLERLPNITFTPNDPKQDCSVQSQSILQPRKQWWPARWQMIQSESIDACTLLVSPPLQWEFVDHVLFLRYRLTPSICSVYETEDARLVNQVDSLVLSVRPNFQWIPEETSNRARIAVYCGNNYLRNPEGLKESDRYKLGLVVDNCDNVKSLPYPLSLKPIDGESGSYAYELDKNIYDLIENKPKKRLNVQVEDTTSGNVELFPLFEIGCGKP